MTAEIHQAGGTGPWPTLAFQIWYEAFKSAREWEIRSTGNNWDVAFWMSCCDWGEHFGTGWWSCSSRDEMWTDSLIGSWDVFNCKNAAVAQTSEHVWRPVLYNTSCRKTGHAVSHPDSVALLWEFITHLLHNASCSTNTHKQITGVEWFWLVWKYKVNVMGGATSSLMIMFF